MYKGAGSQKSKRLAFTLIELLVVCSIITVIAALVLVSYSQAQAKSRDSRRRADLETLQQATYMYQREVGKLPLFQDNSTDWAGLVTDSTFNTALKPYLSKIPVDPQSGSDTRNYYYYLDTRLPQPKFNFYSIMETSKQWCYMPPSSPMSGRQYMYGAPTAITGTGIVCHTDIR